MPWLKPRRLRFFGIRLLELGQLRLLSRLLQIERLKLQLEDESLYLQCVVLGNEPEMATQNGQWKVLFAK